MFAQAVRGNGQTFAWKVANLRECSPGGLQKLEGLTLQAIRIGELAANN
jgi:hypothetical protein